MKLIEIEVAKMENYGNRPRVSIKVDKVPAMKDMIFDSIREGRRLFLFAELEGAVRFFCHDLLNQSGFGGNHFIIKMADGEQHIIKGPWSSRAGVFNALRTLPQVADVYVFDADGRGCSSVTIDWLKSQGLRVARLTAGGETIYEVLDKDGAFYKPLLADDNYYKFICEV